MAVASTCLTPSGSLTSMESMPRRRRLLISASNASSDMAEMLLRVNSSNSFQTGGSLACTFGAGGTIRVGCVSMARLQRGSCFDN
jgi:hypothetical protein